MGERPFRTHRRSRPPARLTISSRVGSVTPSGSSRINSEVRAGIEYTSRSPFTFWSERPTASITICNARSTNQLFVDPQPMLVVQPALTSGQPKLTTMSAATDIGWTARASGLQAKEREATLDGRALFPSTAEGGQVGGHSRLKHTYMDPAPVASRSID